MSLHEEPHDGLVRTQKIFPAWERGNQDTGDPNWEEQWLPRWTPHVDLSAGEGMRCAVG